MYKGSYEVEILVNGSSVKEYSHEGRTFIEGKKGSSFAIRLRNNSYKRKLFVISVDGLSVINGKDASSKSRGYIVGPNSSLRVDGWRKDDDKVAEFYFSSPENSYRQLKKKGDNLGVIGVLVYGEKEKVDYNELEKMLENKRRVKEKPWITIPGVFGGDTKIYNQDQGFITSSWPSGAQNMSASLQATAGHSANFLSVSNSAAPSQDLGTGWGKDKDMPIVTVEFDRADEAEEYVAIYYNTREQLEKEGIKFKPQAYVDRPKAFPADYCEPPF